VAAAQSTEVRKEIAMNSALRTVVPFALLLPLLGWLAARVVRHELAPVRELAREIDRQPGDQPAPVRLDGLPEEIAPFASAINRLLERVGRLMDAQRRFVADAAHELRSPLTALSLQAQNVEQAATLDAARQRVAPLRAGIERARRMTEQLLSLARSQAAGVKTEEVDVGRIVRELIADHLPVAEARRIDLGVGRADERLALETDVELLRVVLKNALDNALRHTPPGGEVTLAFFQDGGDCVIEVADTGPGIPPAEREQAFRPFHRLDGASGEGSGLGLTIARDAAARLGGAIELQERIEGGLAFRYRQPLEGTRPRRAGN
jgi:two-component system OmpR family sensor kinase